MHRGGCRHRGWSGSQDFWVYEALLFSLTFWLSNGSAKDAHVLILETEHDLTWQKKTAGGIKL